MTQIIHEIRMRLNNIKFNQMKIFWTRDFDHMVF